jgi:hypothetical protein
MNYVKNYAQQLHTIYNQVNALLRVAMEDDALDQSVKEDLEIELARLKGAANDCLCAVVDLVKNAEEP